MAARASTTFRSIPAATSNGRRRSRWRTNDGEFPVAPALVDNVETMANLPGILAEGADWFRELGTAESPGSIVCTVTRAHAARRCRRGCDGHDPGRGDRRGRRRRARRGGGSSRAVSGVANPIVPAAQFDTPLTYEAMNAIGSGLGAGGFIVFDDETDLVAVAQAISRFLAVESCGQCTPCKQDGVAISVALDRLRRSDGHADDLELVERRLRTRRRRRPLRARDAAAGGGRQRACACSPSRSGTTRTAARGAAPVEVIAELVDIVDGVATSTTTTSTSSPTGRTTAVDSGQAPADRL